MVFQIMYMRSQNIQSIMELKSKTGLSEETLETLSQKALNQINDKRCDVEMRNEGVSNILKHGIVFSGKKVKI